MKDILQKISNMLNQINKFRFLIVPHFQVAFPERLFVHFAPDIGFQAPAVVFSIISCLVLPHHQVPSCCFEVLATKHACK